MAVGLVGVGGATRAADLQDAIESTVEAHGAARASQTRVDALDNQSTRLLDEYRAHQHQIQVAKVYNAQLDRLITSQQEEMKRLEEQITRVDSMSRELIPLSLAMLDALEQLVALGPPFLTDERVSRVATLRAMMDRADVTTAEKFRRILEAYQIEAEYGRTIEAYSGTLELEGGARTVTFLRIGTVSLTYATRDGTRVGAWDPRERHWVILPSTHAASIAAGLRIARKRAAPDLIRVPVAVP